MRLDSEKVYGIFKDCLFRDGEDTTNHVLAEGIMSKVGFHPERLKLHEPEVIELLDELPEKFKEGSGGGWSFLNACMDKHDIQWGEQLNAEQLLLLGMALGKVQCQAPREMWSMLPGGVPYYVVKA
jgi:hypothetical protein